MEVCSLLPQRDCCRFSRHSLNSATKGEGFWGPHQNSKNQSHPNEPSNSVKFCSSSVASTVVGVAERLGEWILSRRDRLIVARHEVPGSAVWTFATAPDNIRSAEIAFRPQRFEPWWGSPQHWLACSGGPQSVCAEGLPRPGRKGAGRRCATWSSS
jgi:hypothetical protein